MLPVLCPTTFLMTPFSSRSASARRANDPLIFNRSTRTATVTSLYDWTSLLSLSEVALSRTTAWLALSLTVFSLLDCALTCRCGGVHYPFPSTTSSFASCRRLLRAPVQGQRLFSKSQQTTYHIELRCALLDEDMESNEVRDDVRWTKSAYE